MEFCTQAKKAEDRICQFGSAPYLNKRINMPLYKFFLLIA